MSDLNHLDDSTNLPDDIDSLHQSSNTDIPETLEPTQVPAKSLETPEELERKKTLELIRKKKLAEAKRKNFDSNIKNLFIRLTDIIKSKYKYSIEKGNIPLSLICLDNYRQIYNKMTPEEHYINFEIFYLENEINILDTLDDDSWLKDGASLKRNLCIKLGANKPDPEGRRRMHKIMISDIYTLACQLKIETERRLDELGELPQSDVNDLIGPRTILLHLFRIFYYVNENENRPLLLEIINKLEAELGMPKTQDGTVQNKAQPNRNNQNNQQGLGKIFKLATDIMGKMGMEVPENIPIPNDSDIENVITSVMGHEGLQTIFGNVINSANQGTDVTSTLSSVLSNITNEETVNTLRETVSRTAEIAQKTTPNVNINNTL